MRFLNSSLKFKERRQRRWKSYFRRIMKVGSNSKINKVDK